MAEIAVVVGCFPLICLFIYAISYDGLKFLKKTLGNRNSSKKY